MNQKAFLLAVARGAAVALISLPALHAAEKPDYKGIAERIITQCAGVKQGDCVVLRGDMRDIEFLEELGLAVWKQGGEPLQVVNRERANLRFFEEVPSARDASQLPLSLKLAEVETVEINISGQEFPGLLSGVAPSRLSAIERRGLEAFRARLGHGVRIVEIGNGLYPTVATAKRYGISQKQLADLFYNGINVDYASLQATGAVLQAVLKAGKEMRITHTNGTDIRLRVESRVVGVSDGVISAEDIAKGPPHTQVWLPAGEVYVTPVPGSADGKLVFDYSPFEEGALTGATFTFRAGKLVAHTAAPGDSYTRWNAAYADAPSGKDDFAYIDLGINPNVQVPAGTKLTTWVPAGTVSVGLGNNLWAGGTNNGSWSFDISMAGCTVTIDEKVIVERVLHQDTMSDAIRREIIEAPINIARDLVGEVKQTADNAVNSSPSGKSAGTSSARQANDSNDLLSSLLDVATKTAQLADRIGLEATSLTDEQEAAIGREINRNILGDTKEFLDASSQHRVEAIAKQLITQCRRKNIVYTIKLLDSTNVNAFSVAGGYVYVTQAFLKQFPSDAALALTLGHEIAHVDLRHCVEKIQYQVKGKELVGDASNLAQFVYATLRSPYSRSQEFEADAYGFRAAMKSGWRDQQLLQFMRELSAYQRKGAGESQDVETIKRDSMTVLASRLDDYFASHPSTTERVARLEAIAKSE